MSTDAKVVFFGEKEKQREPDVPVELDRKETPAADERRVFGRLRMNYGVQI